MVDKPRTEFKVQLQKLEADNEGRLVIRDSAVRQKLKALIDRAKKESLDDPRKDVAVIVVV